VQDIYKLVADFPSNKKYSLTSQITRSAISIPSNIAEGASRNSEKYFARFLEISLGSVFELETQVRISFGLKYISENKFDVIIDTCISLQKRIYSLRKKVINN
tara:strand:- start:103 stop:411 length:309 start_codon:yes stop_codon:yes gene_type:complete